MKFDAYIAPQRPDAAAEFARHAENYGFAGVWTSETAHNPFLPLTHAAASTNRIEIGTAIAVAFPRSPMITAQIAYDLAAQSDGRFILGLGTQIQAHIERRFSTAWSAPAPRLREYIEALRAIWRSFQTGASLRYKGDHYKFTLLTPFFSPGAIDHPNIPIYIAGVNEALCRLAGELCQGFHVHPFHTPRYLREVILPHIEAGARAAGRARTDCQTACAVLVVTGKDDVEMALHAESVRQQIAFYASTPSYRSVLELHDWGAVGEKLNQLSRFGRWDEMPALITDAMLREFAVVAPYDALPAAVRARYDGLLDRVGYYFPFNPADDAQAPLWEQTAVAFA